jgi:hypothetical protein
MNNVKAPARISDVATRENKGRMGLVHYAKVLAFITVAPATHVHVAKHFGRGVQRMRQLLKRMVHMKLAHVSSWEHRKGKQGMLLPVFSGGVGVCAPYPNPNVMRDTVGRALRRSDVRSELIGFAMVLDLMREPVTRAEIHAETGISHSNLKPLLEALRDLNLIRVGAWVRLGPHQTGKWAETFVMGGRPHAKKPKALSAAVKRKRHVARKRQKLSPLHLVAQRWAANDSQQQAAS